MFPHVFKKLILNMFGKKNYRQIYFLKEKITIPFKVKYICGIKKIKYGKDEAAVVCLVKNGELYVKSFVEHYISLGVKYIILIDNNSEDNTVDIARSYKEIIILGIKENNPCEIILLNHVIKKFCRNRWCIRVDIDELIDYPFSDVITFRQFLEYLNMHSYTAVVGQMLDMFSEKPLNELKPSKDDSLKKKYRYYDISHIEKYDYSTCDKKNINNNKNILSNESIKFHFCGIRDTVFNSYNGLTKHPIIFVGKRINLITSHCVENTHCADIDIVIFHYVFVNLFAKAKQYIDRGYGPLDEYRKYIQKYEQNPNLIIKQDTSRELLSTNELIENGFLMVSKNYLDFVNKRKK